MIQKISDKAVIFDLDGTLLYTLEDLKDSVNFALLKYNYPIRTLDEIRNFVGNGVKPLIERSLPGGAKNPDFDMVLKTFKENYSENMYNKTRPFEGINELLSALVKSGFKIAVVSNKFDKAVKELCKSFFPQISTAIGESENIRKKPAPDSVFKAIELLDAKKCIYVGDSEVDIQTAKNSGLKCISVTWGYKDKDFLIKNGADFIVDTPGEIFEILQKIAL